MSDIPRVNSGYKRKKSEGHQVMQNLEASSLASFKTTEDSENISGAAKKGGNSSDNGSPPTKKKKRTHKPRKVIKGQPRETPCPRWRPPATTAPIYAVAAKFPWVKLLNLDSSSRTLPSTSLTVKAPMKELHRSNGFREPRLPRHLSQRTRRCLVLLLIKDRRVPLRSLILLPRTLLNRSYASYPVWVALHGSAPWHVCSRKLCCSSVSPGRPEPRSLAEHPSRWLRESQGPLFQGISRHGPGPYYNQAHYLIGRLESTLNRVAAGFEANNRLIRQILAQGDQNTNTPVDFNS
ncbi:unnamed protein product [Fusarium fujikuroi]|nr:unnamed protein product [Fusarium fujikuroi]